MAIAAFDFRCTFSLVERRHAGAAIERAHDALDAIFPTELERAGFSQAHPAGFRLAYFHVLPRKDHAIIDRSHPIDTRIIAPVEVVVTVEGDGDDASMAAFAGDAVEGFLAFSDQLIDGFNTTAELPYRSIELDDYRRSDTRAALDPKMRRLLEWRNMQAYCALDEGESGFHRIPNAWWDAATFGCINGHVSTNILKIEAQGGGDLCRACNVPVILIPPMAEAEFQALLPEILSQALPQAAGTGNEH